MKILIPVLHYAPVIGGLETWTQNIAERLSDKTEVFVVTGRVKGQFKEEIKNNVKIFRTSLYSLSNLSHSSLFYILTALPFIFLRSLKIIKKEKIVLLFCQGFLSSLLGCLLSELTKVPFIVTVQRLEDLPPTTFFGKVVRGKNWLKKTVYNRAKVCIAASTAIKKYFQEISCPNIEIIPNGIEIDKFGVRSLSLWDPVGSQWDPSGEFGVREKLGIKDEFVIMTVARLEKVKGLKYLIEALNIFNSQLPTPNSQLLIIGDGSQRKNLELQVTSYKLQNKVRFLGQVPNQEIPDYLAAADCFCLPSLKEGFGIAILEAIATDLPVIATDVGGIPDIITNGLNGILVKPKEPEEIAQALIKIYSQPEFAAKLVQKAKEELAKYDWQKIVERVHCLFYKIVNL